MLTQYPRTISHIWSHHRHGLALKWMIALSDALNSTYPSRNWFAKHSTSRIQSSYPVLRRNLKVTQVQAKSIAFKSFSSASELDSGIFFYICTQAGTRIESAPSSWVIIRVILLLRRIHPPPLLHHHLWARRLILVKPILTLLSTTQFFWTRFCQRFQSFHTQAHVTGLPGTQYQTNVNLTAVSIAFFGIWRHEFISITVSWFQHSSRGRWTQFRRYFVINDLQFLCTFHHETDHFDHASRWFIEPITLMAWCWDQRKECRRTLFDMHQTVLVITAQMVCELITPMNVWLTDSECSSCNLSDKFS
jgi:hypothetical protein